MTQAPSHRDAVFIRDACPADADGIARVHVHSWLTTYRGLVPDTYLDSLSVPGRAIRWAELLAPPRRETILVAETEDKEIVGFASGGLERSQDDVYTGELYGLYLLKEYQRRGIGRRLVSAMAGFLNEQGHAAMLVWVLSTNPARAFYERLGGDFLREQYLIIGGKSLLEYAYGWPDIQVLCGFGAALEQESL